VPNLKQYFTHPIQPILVSTIFSRNDLAPLNPTSGHAALEAHIAKFALNNAILMAFSNSGFLEMVQNFLYFLRKSNVTNFVLTLLDEAAYNFFKDVPQAFYHREFQAPQNIAHFRDSTYQKLCAFAYDQVTWALSWGYDVLVSDTDIAILQNPFPLLYRAPPCDILATSDSIIPQFWNMGIFPGDTVPHYFNTGFVFWRNIPQVIDLWARYG